MSSIDSLNSFLDALPRPRLSCTGRESPTYRACGVAGFYGAVIVVLGSGLMTGRSLLVIGALALVCGLSFFVYAYLRRWIAGHEEIVLLEHVWFALACVSVTLWAWRQPVLPYLDVVSPALCFFLAAGRIGCTLVGCCHGQPSSLGIIYPERCVRDGFLPHLVGVRLFPVPAIEAAGLLAIGVTGLIALPFASAGKVFAWFLLSYSVMRFGLEGIRGDRRPHLLGLSQARWMAVIEVGLAWRLTAGEAIIPAALISVTLLATLIAVLSWRGPSAWRRQLLKVSHVREVRELVRGHIEGGWPGPAALPVSRSTSRRVTVAVSRAEAISPPAVHLSLALPDGRCDRLLLCQLAARAFPELMVVTGQFSASGILHLLAPAALSEGDDDAQTSERLAESLYGSALRRRQAFNEASKPGSYVGPVVSRPTAAAAPPLHANGASTAAHVSHWFFADGRKDHHW